MGRPFCQLGDVFVVASGEGGGVFKRREGLQFKQTEAYIILLEPTYCRLLQPEVFFTMRVLSSTLSVWCVLLFLLVQHSFLFFLV